MVACCGIGIRVFQFRDALFKYDYTYNNLVDSGVNCVKFLCEKEKKKEGGMCFNVLWKEGGCLATCFYVSKYLVAFLSSILVDRKVMVFFCFVCSNAGLK